MSAFQFLLAVFVLAAFLQCQAVPPDEFFPVGSLGGDADLDRTFPPLTISCGDVSQVEVLLTGTANLGDGTDERVTFTPFLVDPNDLQSSVGQDSYRILLDSDPNSESVPKLQKLYETYYPREEPFTIEQVITVTWTLTTDLSGSVETNHFQLVIGFNTMNNSIVILYQYEDEMMQWSSTDSAVSMDICGVTWKYMTLDSSIPLNTAIVTNSNVKVPGRYAFLYRNMMIYPAVICSEGCSIDYGSCEDENTCECRPGWEGDNCTEPECHALCEENGGCLSEPYTCVCNDGWYGGNCTTYDCTNPLLCVNGTCEEANGCTCNQDWSGSRCDMANCSAECINGYCETPFVCTCEEGWNGTNCDQPLCLEGCSTEFGSCNSPGECNCAEGYTGNLCDSTSTTPVATETPTSGSSQSILISTMLAIVFGICTLLLFLG